MKLQLLSDLHLEMQGFYSIEATDADVVILAGDIGHTHSNLDTPIGQCRLISNQKGYPRESVLGDFDKNWIVEV